LATPHFNKRLKIILIYLKSFVKINLFKLIKKERLDWYKIYFIPIQSFFFKLTNTSKSIYTKIQYY